MEKELRRSQSNLRILGTGVIAFTLWVVLKSALVLLLVSDRAPQTDGAAEMTAGAWVFVAVLLSVAVLLVLLRLYLGFSARAEGMGKPRGRTYVVLAFVFFSFQILLFVLTLLQLLIAGLMEQSLLEFAASLLLEISSMVTMGEMAFTAVKVRKLRARKAG